MWRKLVGEKGPEVKIVPSHKDVTDTITRAFGGKNADAIIAASEKCREAFQSTLLASIGYEHYPEGRFNGFSADELAKFPQDQIRDARKEFANDVKETLAVGNVDIANAGNRKGRYKIEFPQYMHSSTGEDASLIVDQCLKSQGVQSDCRDRQVTFTLTDDAQIAALDNFRVAQKERSTLCARR